MIAGSPRTVLDELQAQFDEFGRELCRPAGLPSAIITFDEARRSIELFAEHVMPQLRREAARRRRIVTKGPRLADPCPVSRPPVDPGGRRADVPRLQSGSRGGSLPRRHHRHLPGAEQSLERGLRGVARGNPRAARPHRARYRPPDRAVRRQPDRAQEQSAPAGRSRNLDQAQGAADHHVARRREGTGRRRAGLWRARVPRRDQHAPCAQGGGSRRRWPDRGVRGRGRTCRAAQPVRADSGNPPVLSEDDPAFRRDVDRPAYRGGAHARAPTSPISARASSRRARAWRRRGSRT